MDVGNTISYRASGLRSGTRYEFVVRAIIGSRTSDWSASDDATTWTPTPDPPDPEPEVSRPTGLSATAVSWSEVEVTWNAVSGGDSYDIQMMESGGPWGDTVDAGAGTSYSYTGLTMNTSYGIRVRTVDGSRTSGWTASVSATTEVQPPGNPAATAESANSVRVSWDAVSGADRYDLRRREDGGSWGAPVSAGTGTEYLVGGLAAETRHDFELRTVAASRTSDWTASVSATTPPEVGPPTLLSATAVSWREIAVVWKFVPGADRYELQRSRRGGPWGATVDAGAEPGFEDTGLIGNMVYSYRVRSVAGTGRSAWTAPASTSTEVQPPENPTGDRGVGELGPGDLGCGLQDRPLRDPSPRGRRFVGRARERRYGDRVPGRRSGGGDALRLRVAVGGGAAGPRTGPPR